jgi:adenylate kinase family enzyme
MDAAPRVNAPNYVADIGEAATILKAADRILVIGCSGGGKSTFSQIVAKRFRLTYISIDRDILWLPGWVQRDKAEQRAIMATRVLEDRWILDGTSPASFDIRLPRTDIVIWVRMPRLLCIWAVVSRWIKFFGTTRPEMAPGCIEKIDWQFLHFIWTFERQFTPRILAGLVEHGATVPVFQLKNRADMKRLLDLLSVPA